MRFSTFFLYDVTQSEGTADIGKATTKDGGAAWQWPTALRLA
jgi:hypothetical protein